MKDYGTRQTDLAVKRAEWRLSRVYSQAQRDMAEKLKAWQEGHERREKRYRQMVDDGKMSQKDFDAWMRGQVFQGKQWQAKKEQIDNILLNADKAAQNLIDHGKLGMFAEGANHTMYEVEQVTGIETEFAMYDENTVARLIKSDPQMLPKARQGVKKDKAISYYNKLMNSAITQGIVQGETIPQIAKRIVDKTGESSYASAVRNARTAYTGAQNAGRMEGLHQAQRLGINVKKKWLATLDSRTRDAHADLDGQIQEVDDPFESELGDIMYPGDPTADPGNVYNCRCTLVYVYPDYPSEMQRRDNETGEIVGDMTYREWEAMKQGEGKQKSIESEKKDDSVASISDLEKEEAEIREQNEALNNELFEKMMEGDSEAINRISDAIDNNNSRLQQIERDKAQIADIEKQRADWVSADNFANGNVELINKLISGDPQQVSEAVDTILSSQDYNFRASAWNGHIYIKTVAESGGAAGCAMWDGPIWVREDCANDIKVHIHEHLHMRSANAYGREQGPIIYKKNKAIEEGTVEYMAQEICKRSQVPYSGAYPEYVNPLRTIRMIIAPQESDYDFAHDLIDVAAGERYSWISDRVSKYIDSAEISKKEKQTLTDCLYSIR